MREIGTGEEIPLFQMFAEGGETTPRLSWRKNGKIDGGDEGRQGRPRSVSVPRGPHSLRALYAECSDVLLGNDDERAKEVEGLLRKYGMGRRREILDGI